MILPPRRTMARQRALRRKMLIRRIDDGICRYSVMSALNDLEGLAGERKLVHETFVSRNYLTPLNT